MALSSENSHSKINYKETSKNSSSLDPTSGLITHTNESSIEYSHGEEKRKLNIQLPRSLSDTVAGVIILVVTSLPFDYVNNSAFSASLVLSGTGGPEVVFFADEFRHTDKNYICDEDIYGIDYQGGSTQVHYSKDVSLGEVIEYDFRPSGQYASNVTFTRPDLYEIVFGDNDFTHISLKDLNRDSFLNLTTENVKNQSRAKLNNALSTTTNNTVRVEERFVSESEMILVIVVNSQEFTSDSIFVENRSKNKNLSLGLLDLNKDRRNYTAVDFYELKICD
ncbi:MAG: hypothetical protein KBC78_01815 [Candidatus Pacebacteria bacterium]|nr:hypothetical protein [Candidatus Paceibacterota bacterium]